MADYSVYRRNPDGTKTLIQSFPDWKGAKKLLNRLYDEAAADPANPYTQGSDAVLFEIA